MLISDEGEPAEGITKEGYEAATMWHYDEKEEGLIAGSQPEDVAVMLKGKDYMKDASQYFMSDKEMMAINSVMNALGRFKLCKSEALVKESIDDALKDLADYFEHCRNHGGLRILKGKRPKYIDILNGLKSDYLQKIIDFLSNAEEKDEDFDDYIRTDKRDPVSLRDYEALAYYYDIPTKEKTTNRKHDLVDYISSNKQSEEMMEEIFSKAEEKE